MDTHHAARKYGTKIVPYLRAAWRLQFSNPVNPVNPVKNRPSEKNPKFDGGQMLARSATCGKERDFTT